MQCEEGCKGQYHPNWHFIIYEWPLNFFFRMHKKNFQDAPKFFFQDAKFLSKYMPQLMSHLHYRIVDVSTIKEIAKRWYPDVAVIQLHILIQPSWLGGRAVV